MKTIFLQAVAAADKASALRLATGSQAREGEVGRFAVDPSQFTLVPGSPFAYWISDEVRELFVKLPSFESDRRTAKNGLNTADDFRFVRASWEIDANGAADGEWRPFAKGGALSPFYADIHLVVKWDRGPEDARELKSYIESRPGTTHWSRRASGSRFYLRPGLTWPLRASRFAPQALPSMSIFSVRGYGAFMPDEQLLTALALFNSRPFDSLFKTALGRYGFPEFVVGVLQRMPWREPNNDERRILDSSSRRVWGLRRSLDTRVETSHAFVLPALLQGEGGASFAVRADAWAGRVRAVEAELKEIQAEIDERCFDLYGIDEEDRRAISDGLAGAVDGVDAEEPVEEADDADDEQEAGVDAAALAAELVSWAVGVAFGRFDVRLAGGERELPDEPGPFDPLPVCSPGTLVGEDELPVAGRPPGYPIDFPESGILVDDPGDPRDLVGAVRTVFDVVFGAGADGWWDEAAALLDARGHDLRVWLRSSFFERHLRLYSKSRRKAPILWQLGTPSGRYSVWLYAHRLTDDSFFRLQNDVLAQKLAYEERQLTSLVQSSRGSPSAKERREIEAQEVFVEELRVLLDEVRRVAPLLRPTLDDGIVLVMAPLWRLVPHKSWQRELKTKWAELAAGKYDWAQLAMHLWPERVVPKCAEDRSLAIAHRLEDVFWIEDEHGKWRPRDEPTTDVDDLIRKRTSAAVEDALGGST